MSHVEVTFPDLTFALPPALPEHIEGRIDPTDEVRRLRDEFGVRSTTVGALMVVAEICGERQRKIRNDTTLPLISRDTLAEAVGILEPGNDVPDQDGLKAATGRIADIINTSRAQGERLPQVFFATPQQVR